MLKRRKPYWWVVAVLYVTIGVCPSFVAGAQPQFVAPTNDAELKQRVDTLRRQYTPYLQSLPEKLSLRRRTPIDRDWLFRFEVQDAPLGMERPEAPGWFGPDLDVDAWQRTTVPQWRYRRTEAGRVLGGKDKFGWGERGEHSNIVWYRSHFAAQAPPDGRRLWLCFDGVDWEAEVYLNGELLGGHRVYYEPFRFDVTRELRGTNTLAVRVIDGRVFGEPHAFWTPLPDARAEEQIYVRDAKKSLRGVLPIGYHGGNGFGILREVFLEETGPAMVSEVFVRSDLSDGNARVRIEFDSDAARTLRLNVQLMPENFQGRAYEKTITCKLPSGPGAASMTIPMRDAKAWSQTSPHLYRCRVTVLDGSGPIDTKDALFGCRSFGIVSKQNPREGLPEGMFLLNDRPIYLRGTSVHGLNAYSYWNQEDKLLSALLLLKAANFNVVRVCQHVNFPEVRELMDRLGMMSEQDQGSGYRQPKTGLPPQIAKQLVHTGKVLARECYNNPGVVLLSFGNECHFDATELVKAVLAVDPQRIVKPSSGRLGFGGKGQALLSEDLWANVIDDVHTYAGWYGQRYARPWRRVFQRPAQRLVMVGEYGAEALDAYSTMRDAYPEHLEPPPPDTDTLWASSQVNKQDVAQLYGFGGKKPANLAQYIEASQNYQEAILADTTIGLRISPRAFSGYFHFHFMDVTPAFWPKSIVSCDQKPKKAYYQMAQINQPLVPLPQLTGKRPDTLALWVANDLPEPKPGCTVTWKIVGRGGQRIDGSARIDVPGVDAVAGETIDLTPITSQSESFDLALTLTDAQGHVVSRYARHVLVAE